MCGSVSKCLTDSIHALCMAMYNGHVQKAHKPKTKKINQNAQILLFMLMYAVGKLQ